MRLFICLMISCLLIGCRNERGGAEKAPADGTAETARLAWTAPEGWTREEPDSPMRKAQYLLSRVEGDPEDAAVFVFYLQGQGGSADANIRRWTRQFVQPDGTPSEKKAKVKETRRNNLKITTLDISGTYQFSATPMGPVSEEKFDFRMLAVIIENRSGPYFVKFVGPKRTVAHWEKSFDEFMLSFKETL